MFILGIESSCDDTSVALIEATENGFFVLSEKTASQIEVHKKYGGVVPEIAGRKHAENIIPVLEEVIKGYEKPNLIAVTSGPGLITGLVVGVEVAKSLSYLWDVPIASINHIDGHIHSVEIPNPNDKNQINKTRALNKSQRSSNNKKISFPALCLIVSGGHTELILMKDHGKYNIIGKTVDDAAGECFDKAAKLLGFDYPGGPKISQHALEGNTKAIDFPRPMMNSNDYNFSFAGLKTSALYWLRDNKFSSKITINDFCASFEQAIMDVLIKKTVKAAKEYKPKTVILAGGVSANKKLRRTLEEKIKIINPNINCLLPMTKYSMDNAAMIAIAGYYKSIKKEFIDWQNLTANPNWKIDEKLKV